MIQLTAMAAAVGCSDNVEDTLTICQIQTRPLPLCYAVIQLTARAAALAVGCSGNVENTRPKVNKGSHFVLVFLMHPPHPTPKQTSATQQKH